MKIENLLELLNAKGLVTTDLTREINNAYAADLMSDVLALTNAEPATTLITGLTSKQVVRVAITLDIDNIILVRGKMIDQESIMEASEGRLNILATRMTMFQTCGILYHHGIKPCRNISACLIQS